MTLQHLAELAVLPESRAGLLESGAKWRFFNVIRAFVQ
jgi:hypothetical protein